MGKRVRGRHHIDAPPSPWCGHLAWTVTTHGGHPLGELNMRVGYDDVSLYFAGRNLGCIERDRLRRWLQQPTGLMRIDDVTLAMRGRTLMIALDTVAPPAPVPPREAARLVAAV